MSSNPQMLPMSSVNPTLNFLKANKASSKIFTIVDAAGGGDYKTIYDAVNAAKKYIFVKAGTYAETHNIILDGQTIVGESPQNTIINLGSSYSVSLKSSTAMEKAGTLTVTNASKTVTGAATAFNNISGSNIFLVINGIPHKVNSIGDATTLTLENNYYGQTVSGLSFFLLSVSNTGSSFENFTVYSLHSAQTASISLSGVNSHVKNCIIKNSSASGIRGILLGPSTTSMAIACSVKECYIEFSTTGIIMQYAQGCIIDSNTIEGVNTVAIGTDTASLAANYNIISNNIVGSGSQDSIKILAGNDHNDIIGNNIQSPRASGIKLAASYCKILNNKIVDSRLHGIDLGSSAYNVFKNNLIKNTVDYGISGGDVDKTVFDSNSFISIGSTAIDLDTDSDKNSLTNNKIISPANRGFLIAGNENIISSNYFESCGSQSIWITGNENIITLNSIKTPGAEAIEVDGNDNTLSNNQIDTGVLKLDGNHNITTSNVSSGGNIASTGNYNIISNNSINAPTDVGLDCSGDYLVISGNKIYNGSSNGIVSTGSFVLISENIIIDCTVGIYIIGLKSIISSNQITSPSSYGIHIEGAAGSTGPNTITNNQITSPTGSGILSDESLYSNISNNTVLSGLSNGIELSAADYSIVSQNNVHANVGTGILIDNNSDRCVITENIILTNTAAQLTNNGTNTVAANNIVA